MTNPTQKIKSHKKIPLLKTLHYLPVDNIFVVNDSSFNLVMVELHLYNAFSRYRKLKIG